MTEIGLCLYSAVVYDNISKYYDCVVKQMSKDTGFTPPAILWIMSDVNANDPNAYVNFPKPSSGGPWNNIIFSNQDQNDAYFTYFDSVGVKVYLQGLPSNASVSDIIKLGLDRYSHHSCIAGWGLDVEWLQFLEYNGGRPVTNAEASSWVSIVKSYNPDYKLQLTHWQYNKMPTTHYDGVVYIDDGLGTSSLAELVNAFKSFASHFPDGTCAVDIGYMDDQSWWKNLTNPAANISVAMKQAYPSLVGSYWWGDTLKIIYPTCTTSTVVSSITIVPASVSIGIQMTKQLTAVCKDQNNATMICPALTWVSSNSAVATVNSSGLVTGVTTGTASITASASGVTSNVSNVTITSPTSVLTVITIVPASVSIGVQTIKQLTAVCKDQNNATMICPALTWVSSNSAVATVNSSGLVTGVTTGTASITASASGVISNVSNVTITSPTSVLTVMTISPVLASININGTIQLITTCIDQNGNTMVCPVLTWVSSNSAVATVNSSGLVTGVTTGTASITARSGLISNISTVAVGPILGSNLLLNPGFELSTKTPGMPDNWSKYPGTWSSTAKLTYPDIGNDGSKAINISQTKAGYKQSLIQPVNIIAGTNYTIGGYATTANVIGTGAVIGIDWFTSSGTYISSNIIYLGGTNPWANKIATVKSPSNAAKANFYVGLFGTGKAIFDNVSLRKL